jgi:hypothetical protein
LVSSRGAAGLGVPHLSILGNHFAKLFFIGTDQLFNFRFVFEDLKRWHGADTTFLGSFFTLVNIHLDKDDPWELFCHCSKFGTNKLAWPAPRCGKVNDDGFFSCLSDGFIELSVVCHKLHHSSLDSCRREREEKRRSERVGLHEQVEVVSAEHIHEMIWWGGDGCIGRRAYIHSRDRVYGLCYCCVFLC